MGEYHSFFGWFVLCADGGSVIRVPLEPRPIGPIPKSTGAKLATDVYTLPLAGRGDRLQLDETSNFSAGPKPRQDVPAELSIPETPSDPEQDLASALETIRSEEEGAMGQTFLLTVTSWQDALQEPKTYQQVLAQVEQLQEKETKLTTRLESLRLRLAWAARTLKEEVRAGDRLQAQERVRAELFLNGFAKQEEGLEECLGALRNKKHQLETWSEEANKSLQLQIQSLGLVHAILQEDFSIPEQTLAASGCDPISAQGMNGAMKALLGHLGMGASDADTAKAWEEMRTFIRSSQVTRGPVLERVLQREHWLLTFGNKDLATLRQVNGGSFTRQDLENAVSSDCYTREQKDTFRKLLKHPQLFQALDTARYGPGGENGHVGGVDLDAFASVITARGGPIFLPTFYDARRDAEFLHNSDNASAWGNVLWNRSAAQRAQIIMAHQERYGKDLGQAIEDTFSYHDKGYVTFLLERQDHETIVHDLESWPVNAGRPYSDTEHVQQLRAYMETLKGDILFQERNIRQYDKEAPFYVSNLYREDRWAHAAIRNAEAAYAAYQKDPTAANKQRFIQAMAALQTEGKKVYRIYDTALADRSSRLGTALTVARLVRDSAIAAEISLLTGGLATGSLAIGGSAAWSTGGRIGLALLTGTGAGTVMRSAARLQDNWVMTGKAHLGLADVANSAKASAIDAGLAVVLGLGLPKIAQTMQAAQSSRVLRVAGRVIDKLAVVDRVDPKQIPLRVIGLRLGVGALGTDAKQIAANVYNQKPLTEELWKATIDGALRGVSGTVRR